MSRVAIILLNYNSASLTRDCIKSIKSNSVPEHEYEIFVWDNASPDESLDADSFPGTIFHQSPKNLGFAAGYNAAVKYVLSLSKPDYLLILNNDTLITSSLIPGLISASRSVEDFCLAAPKIYFAAGHEYHSTSYQMKQKGKVIWFAGGVIDWANLLPFHWGVDELDRGQFDTLTPTTFVTGCCFLITPKNWAKLNGFDPAYFMHYEDLDLSIRATRAGLSLLFVPNATLYHINAGSSKGSGSDLQIYYQTRNRLRFGLKYASFRTKLALLREARTQWLTGTPIQKRGILHALEGKWEKQ